MSISRRDFLGTAALGAVAANPLVSATGMPMRTFGSTGAQVSILAFGGGSRFTQYQEEEGIAVLNRALDLGITYIDTADDYGRNGESQVRIGKVLKARGRKGLWLASKISPEQRKQWSKLGGLARAERHTSGELSKWAKLGGRPKKKHANLRQTRIIFGTVPLVQKNGSSAFTLRSSRRSFKTRISRSIRCGKGKGPHSTRLTTPEVPRATQVPDETLSTAE